MSAVSVVEIVGPHQFYIADADEAVAIMRRFLSRVQATNSGSELHGAP
jgi:hypothetical protein